MRLEIRSEGGNVCRECGSTELMRTADTYEELRHSLGDYIASEVTLAELALTQRFGREKTRMLEVVQAEKDELRARMLKNREGLERELVALFERPFPWYRPLAKRRQDRWRTHMQTLVDDYRKKTYRV